LQKKSARGAGYEVSLVFSAWTNECYGRVRITFSSNRATHKLESMLKLSVVSLYDNLNLILADSRLLCKGRAIGMSCRLSVVVCPFVTDVLWLTVRW